MLESGEDRVHRFPRHVQYKGVGEEEVDETDIHVVGQHLVRESGWVRRTRSISASAL